MATPGPPTGSTGSPDYQNRRTHPFAVSWDNLLAAGRRRGTIHLRLYYTEGHAPMPQFAAGFGRDSSDDHRATPDGPRAGPVAGAGRQAAEAARPAARGHPRPPLQPPHRGGLSPLGDALHLLPRRPTPRRDGGRGDQRLPHRPGGEWPRQRLDAEPGVFGALVPVPAGAASGPGPDRGGRPGGAAAAAAGGPDARRGAAGFRFLGRPAPVNLHAA